MLPFVADYEGSTRNVPKGFSSVQQRNNTEQLLESRGNEWAFLMKVQNDKRRLYDEEVF
jgi:paraquat-inducible protein B